MKSLDGNGYPADCCVGAAFFFSVIGFNDYRRLCGHSPGREPT